MKGAVFYCSKYGSTKQYADWIAGATGLPIFDVKNERTDPAMYDFLIIGSPIIYFKVLIRKWIRKHLVHFEDKPIVFFSVSGAPAGERLNGWIENSLPKRFVSRMYHVALRGRQIRKKLTFFDKVMLMIGSMFNKDPEARKQERKGFDFMDKEAIDPVVKRVHQFQSQAD
ncbi:flavodoxin domain-containing protein [Flagellimonas meishanensis]|uniref:flavodoxin domain-containing protein n=1 Tax=Flagellimonas meishanensis TaxID=2873264 RepID=UPI001CA5FA24|nr:flavodoxin domain-containing protein [[Muricauda] meishanensis]